MNRIVIFGLAALLLGTVSAQAADEWGIDHEQVARWDGKVVDILCEITGDCPANCGDGKRQLGLILDDGRLVPMVKNFDPFAGAQTDLKDFCGKRVTADGLFIDNPKMPLFALQFKRPAPDGDWSRANWFVRDWAKQNGAAKKDEWFRNDPAVKKIIARDGVFGIPGIKPEE